MMKNFEKITMDLLNLAKKHETGLKQKFNKEYRNSNDRLYRQKLSIWEKDGKARMYVPFDFDDQCNGYIDLLTGEVKTFRNTSEEEEAVLKESLNYLKSLKDVEPITSILVDETEKAICLPSSFSFSQMPGVLASISGKVWIPKSVVSDEDLAKIKSNDITQEFMNDFERKHNKYFNINNFTL